MNKLESLLFEPKGGMYREFTGLVTHFRPKNLSFYRELLPHQFSMPDQPIVGIFFSDYSRLYPWPMTRYQEWALLLKTNWKGDVGWYAVTLPVTKWVPLVGGRYLGFPKYLVEEMSLTKTDQGYTAISKKQGQVQLSLKFTPGLSRDLESWEKLLIEDESFFKGNTQQLVPPGKGPKAKKIIVDHVVPAHWAPIPGMVRVEVNPDEYWKDLLPKEGVFPGTYNHFNGAFNLTNEALE